MSLLNQRTPYLDKISRKKEEKPPTLFLSLSVSSPSESVTSPRPRPHPALNLPHKEKKTRPINSPNPLPKSTESQRELEKKIPRERVLPVPTQPEKVQSPYM